MPLSVRFLWDVRCDNGRDVLELLKEVRAVSPVGEHVVFEDEIHGDEVLVHRVIHDLAKDEILVELEPDEWEGEPLSEILELRHHQGWATAGTAAEIARLPGKDEMLPT